MHGAAMKAVGTFLAALLAAASARADGSIAIIKVSAAAASASLSGHYVEGVMSFRGSEYVVVLRGASASSESVGATSTLATARNVEGVYKRSGDELKNAAGVVLRFDPPLVLATGRLEVELVNRRTPKVSAGHRESGVD